MSSPQQNQLRYGIQITPNDSVLIEFSAQSFGCLQGQVKDKITWLPRPIANRVFTFASNVRK